LLSYTGVRRTLNPPLRSNLVSYEKPASHNSRLAHAKTSILVWR